MSFTGDVTQDCQRHTTGGKGNRGKFIERDKRICAAGVPTAQAELTVESALQQYLLKDEVDALMSDAIIPPPSKPRSFPPTRKPIKPDQRHSSINSSELAQLVNPPNESKFQSFVSDLKNTVYKSYWKAPLGQAPDSVPMFPAGYDIGNATFGYSTGGNVDGKLYNLVMPKDPLPDPRPPSKREAIQTCRNYCRPAFNPDLTYGYRTKIDNRGIFAQCCLTDDRVVQGTAERTHMNYIKADQQMIRQPTFGKPLAPNIMRGVTDTKFDKLPEHEDIIEILSSCKINPKLSFFRECLAQLNSLRISMSGRFLPTFFKKLYLALKYYDKDKSGWIPKQIVYDNCNSRLVRFDPLLIEPLLCMWKAFDGSNIEYKTFTHVLNFKQPLPELPKVPDFLPECLDFRTTYGEMVKLGQEPDKERRAGLPSGRYMDMDYPITPKISTYCRAHRTCLPEESDAYSNLVPSIFTLLHVNHRDMYAKREPALVRKVFEAAGEKFTDEIFNKVWEEAKKHHSLGWVCYETFRRALETVLVPSEEKNYK